MIFSSTCTRFGARLLGVAIVLFCAVQGESVHATEPGVISPFQPKFDAAAARALAEARSRQPMAFEPNVGQVNEGAEFLARGGDYSVELTRGAGLRQWNAGSSTDSPQEMVLLGADPNARSFGLEPLANKTNYSMGTDRGNWRGGIANFAKVRYRDVYPGVDVVYHGNSRQLEYDFEVGPGADPSRIKMGFRGVEGLRVDAASGDLVITGIDGATTRHTRPSVYQQTGGRRTLVRARYQLLDRHAVAFALGNYDRSRALIIDPTVISTQFIKGNNTDQPTAIAVDASGNSFITGTTDSIFGFPSGFLNINLHFGTKSCQPGTLFGGWKCPNAGFIIKLSAAGQILTTTFFGGTGLTIPQAITVDSQAVYVAGGTFSPEIDDGNDYGVPGGSYSSNTPPGTLKSFVAYFGTNNTALFLSTTLGAAGLSMAHGIAVDASHAVYVAGSACGAGFPTSELVNRTSFQPSFHGGFCDAYVTKLDPYGLLNGGGYSTYLGGSQFDAAMAIVVDAVGAAWVTGQTCSVDFPVTNPQLNRGNPGTRGGCTAFVTEMAPDGRFERYSFLLGGTDTPSAGLTYDQGNALVVNGTDGVYLAGETTSNNLPVTANAAQAAHPCQSDQSGSLCQAGFVAYISAGANVQYLTYLGGASSSRALSVTKSSRGDVYVGGMTTGYLGFPGAPAITPNPSAGYVTRLSADLTSVGWTQFLGAQVNSLVAWQSRLRFPFGGTYPTILYTTGLRLGLGGIFSTSVSEDGFVVTLTDDRQVILPPIRFNSQAVVSP